MSSNGQPMGRVDQETPLLSWRARANLTMIVLAVMVAGAWHLSIVATATGVGIGDVGATVAAIKTGHPLAGVPAPAQAGSTTATLIVFGLLLAAAFGLVLGWAFLMGSLRRRRLGGRGFADRGEVRDGMGEARARASASQTRPGLSEKARRKADITQIGLPLGKAANGADVVLPLEDHLIVVATTGAGKTRDVMGPAALDAPGAAVITCTRADLLDMCATTRKELGRVWVFDPLDRVGWPDPMVWNPVAGCRDGETAISRAMAFTAGLGADDKGSTNGGFFRANAASALTRLLHAADLGERPMSDVLDWAIHLEDGGVDAQALIRRSTLPEAEHSWAGMLRSVATGADETVASSRQTLQQVIEPLALRKVLRWVTPRPGVPVFDPRAFVTSTDTLVLVADANANTNVAPLCSMLLQEVVDAAKSIATPAARRSDRPAGPHRRRRDHERRPAAQAPSAGHRRPRVRAAAGPRRAVAQPGQAATRQRRRRRAARQHGRRAGHGWADRHHSPEPVLGARG